MKKAEGTASASALIDQRIAELGDWRGEMLAQIRAAVTLNLAKKPYPNPLPGGEGTDRGDHASYADLKYRVN